MTTFKRILEEIIEDGENEKIGLLSEGGITFQATELLEHCCKDSLSSEVNWYWDKNCDKISMSYQTTEGENDFSFCILKGKWVKREFEIEHDKMLTLQQVWDMN